MTQPTWPTPNAPKRRPRSRRRWGMTIGILGVLVALGAGFYGGYQFFNHKSDIATLVNPQRSASANAATQPLHGYTAPNVANATDQGALNANEQLTLSITMPLRNQGQLSLLLANQYNPQSPFYHRFLTPDQFRQDYGPSPFTLQQAKDLMIKSGLKIVETSNWQFLTVQAPVSTIQQVFHVQLHNFSYVDSDGQTVKYYAPAGTPTLDSSLAGLVQNITGLDSFAAYHSSVRRQTQATSTGYTPQQLQKAYGADKLISQGIDGTGQTLAFMELADFKDADVINYQKQYGLTGGTFTRVPVDGGSRVSGGSIEVELDMEIGFAIAPKANQLVYIGPNSSKGLNDIYSQIVNDNKASIVSISWGLCEAQTGSAELQTLNQIFQQGAAQGMSFFAASGDSGAYDCNTSTLAVDSPADDPFVTGVGGTNLQLATDGTYTSEKAWSCSPTTNAKCGQRSRKGSGGGGGISAFFPQPTYQQGLKPAGTTAAARFVPDIAANADPQTGYAIYCTVTQASCSGNLVVGGTSAAAPLWAAGMILINQFLGQQTKPATLGNANPAIYAAAKAQASVLNDVTAGDNLFYKASAGYDLATGLGTPNFPTLANAIAGNPGTPPAPTPTPSPVGTPTATPISGNPTATPISGNPTATPISGNPTATPVPTPTGNGVDLINNGSFENGTTPWVQSSAGNYYLVDGDNPHSGKSSADFCGYRNCKDIVGQGFQVPTQFTTITLSYWWDLVTLKVGSKCSDTFTVSIYTVTSSGTLGQEIQQVQQSCNTNATKGYRQQTIDLTAALSQYSGKELALIFTGQSDGSLLTSRMFVDDVLLQYS